MNPDKIRNVLNILFMVLALAAIIVYFVAKDDSSCLYTSRRCHIHQAHGVLFIRFTNR